MAEFNHKDERIYKLWKRGLTVGQIARKIGDPDNVARVADGLERKGVRPFADVPPKGKTLWDEPGKN